MASAPYIRINAAGWHSVPTPVAWRRAGAVPPPDARPSTSSAHSRTLPLPYPAVVRQHPMSSLTAPSTARSTETLIAPSRADPGRPPRQQPPRPPPPHDNPQPPLPTCCANRVRGRVIGPDDPDTRVRAILAGGVTEARGRRARADARDVAQSCSWPARQAELTSQRRPSGAGHGRPTAACHDLRDLKAIESTRSADGLADAGLTGRGGERNAEHGLAIGFGDTGRWASRHHHRRRHRYLVRKHA